MVSVLLTSDKRHSRVCVHFHRIVFQLWTLCKYDSFVLLAQICKYEPNLCSIYWCTARHPVPWIPVILQPTLRQKTGTFILFLDFVC